MDRSITLQSDPNGWTNPIGTGLIDSEPVAPADIRHARISGVYRRCRTSLPRPRGAPRRGAPATAPRSQIGWLPQLWQNAGNPSADFPCGYGWETARPERRSQSRRRFLLAPLCYPGVSTGHHQFGAGRGALLAKTSRSAIGLSAIDIQVNLSS